MNQYEKDHLELVESTAAECTLFLKTDGSFPLNKAGKIAAYGSGVRKTVKGGTGSGEVNSRFSINVEEGLSLSGFEITSSKWLDAYDAEIVKAKDAFIKSVKDEAKALHTNAMMICMGKTMAEPEYELPIDAAGDTAIYVVARNSGEGADRAPKSGDVKLTKTEIRDILEANKKYEKFMLVLNVGGAVDLSDVSSVKNILILSQLGVVTGKVLADILLGKANPSGKLATTWAKWEDYSTVGDIGNPDDTLYKEGIYVGYRYFDSVGKKALFPFGFGKSYTEFSIGTTKTSSEKDEVSLSVKVKNAGRFPGKEVVQVYVSAPCGKLDKPYQDLVAFKKTKLLSPGEEEELDISFKLSDFPSYDEEAEAYILEEGNYVVRVGNSSVSTIPSAVISLEDTITLLKVRNCLGKPSFEDWKPDCRVCAAVPGDIEKLVMTKDDFSCSQVTYDVDYPIDEKIKALSDEELIYMNTGAFNPKAKGMNVIGSAASHVAGAAGETTSLVEGIKPIIMADGPAGVRLSREYYEDEKGAHSLCVSMLPDSMLDFATGLTGFVLKHFMSGKKPKKGVEIKEQYATAIPIGTAIAQSFNYDLAKQYGDMVGSEMERFRINLWLAPAMNIHRSILCGRNFEYYSEDPLVSGLMAAAITEGVQLHEGCGTTIKHYAANNAEINRYANNSQVSERAMREIYLKGFGICVKKSQPHAVMTSYNLLNGTHTSEHRGLIEDILRCEYGLKGIVMTDWVVAMMVGKDSKYRGALAPCVAMAGGDLFMPGSKPDYNLTLSQLKEGKIDRKQLEINATRVYRKTQEMLK